MARSIRTMARKEFWEMAEIAKSEGKDLGEVLDRCGVLLTPGRKAQIEHAVYVEMINMLESSSAHEWADADNRMRSPDDMKRAFTKRLKLFAEAYERKAYAE